jgi:2-haloacid dehalogenase
MPRALVFDAYGTLFDVYSVQARCEILWPGKGAQLSQLWRAKQLEYTWQRSLMGRYAPFSQVTEEALLFSCEFLGLKINGEEKQTLLAEYGRLALYPDVLPAMKQFESLTCAILSNGSPDMLQPLVAQSGLKFDAVLSVDEVKLYKPAPAVYELAVRKLGEPKEQIAFVSSNCWDALGAKSFGFTVYWINRADAPVDRMGLDLDFAISSLKDLNQKL